MYKKTLIRAFFTELLKQNVASVSQRVYSGRLNPKEDENYPYLTVYTKDEDIVEQSTMSTKRELALHIGIVVKNNDIDSGDFDEVIDNLMYDVEVVMSQVLSVQTKAVNDFYALVDDVVLERSVTDADNSSGSDIGGGMLVYKVDYEMMLPVSPVVLEDFDLQGSIDNIQITNPGVPSNV